MQRGDRLSQIFGIQGEEASEPERHFLSPTEIRLIAEGNLATLAAFSGSSRLNAPDLKGDTPLHLAARKGNLAVCDLFIRSGADPNSLNHELQTPAEVALSEGHSLLAQLLSALVTNSADTQNEEVAKCKVVSKAETVVSKLDAVSGPHMAEMTSEVAGDEFDGLLNFEAEVGATEFFDQHMGETASGKLVTLVSPLPQILDVVDWDVDLSPANISGDGIGANAVLPAITDEQHDFLRVRKRGPKSTRKAVLQTGTRLSIDAVFCLAWVEELFSKGSISCGDLDRLIDSCDGNGDPDELRYNLERNLELAGFTLDTELLEDTGLWDFKSNVSAEELAEIIEATLTRSTQLPGTRGFFMGKRDELLLLEPMIRAKQELLLGILASKAAVEAILDVVEKIVDGSREPGSFSLRTIITWREGHAETLEVLAASEALKLWHLSGRVMDGKRRREALAALDALDLSLEFQKDLVTSLKRNEGDNGVAVQLEGLIWVYESAIERLVVRHLSYVRRFASRSVESDEDPEEVFQVAFLGLQRSAKRFDPELGYRFLIYAAFWMRQAIMRWRADEGAAVRIPFHRYERITKLERALDKLDVKVGGAVSDFALAEELDWTSDEVTQFRNIPREAEYPECLGDWDKLMLEQPEEDIFYQADAEKIVSEILAELPERQADVLRLRFGIGRDSDMTLEEVGQIYGVTRERIRQIEAKAFDRLSHPGRIRRLRSLLGYEGHHRLTDVKSKKSEEQPYQAASAELAEKGRKTLPWIEDRVDRLRCLWAAGKSAREIAQEMGDTSRNAVIGKLSRLGLADSNREESR